ncbi:MAG: tRNA preQ1(34) S-adenosylmethionine ribosyltransferase-isomerase QueA [Pseudomonadota bacterium]
MRRQDFHFDLPLELIAHYPSEQRTDCRLLHLDGRSGAVSHAQFAAVKHLLEDGDLLVFNNTKVIPARLHGQKPTGGKLEILLERVLGDGLLLAQVGSSKPIKPGAELRIIARESHEYVGSLFMVERRGDFFILRLDEGLGFDDLFARAGHMPLPPYIKREDEQLDIERYQTVFASQSGAVAAPTAGLHFDEALIEDLIAAGIDTTFVTLHVGAATFQPIRVDDVEEHQMHSEYVDVNSECCEKVQATWRRGGRVVAVGSTSVRALESASQTGQLKPFCSDSALFIYPGYEFRCVDAMITNFHLSESSLLMMVSAFAGREHVLSAYQQAVAERYRFFSYGDAMFIEASRAPALRTAKA